MLDNLFREEIFPQIQPKSSLIQLEGISSGPVTHSWEQSLTQPGCTLMELWRITEPHEVSHPFLQQLEQ